MQCEITNINILYDDSDEIKGSSLYKTPFYEITISMKGRDINILPYIEALKYIPFRLYIYLGLNWQLNEINGATHPVDLERGLIYRYKKQSKKCN